jgi:hypothetical protein
MLSYIITVIRNDRGVSMSSVEGELIIVLLAADGQVLAQQPVRLMVADAIFAGLPAGNYTIIVRHSFLQPTEARQDIVLKKNTMLGLKYIYAESTRTLESVEIIERRLDG